MGLLDETISTHAPRAGSDMSAMRPRQEFLQFQPTLPVRGATAVSIEQGATGKVFQPTLPVRGATEREYRGPSAVIFQPTLPVRGATAT